ncbi:MAG TPA: SDR family oxidoreductase [Acidisarcina sp.]
MTELDGQVAVVTGAGRGIGKAIALRLAEMGPTVLLVGRDVSRLEQVREQIDRQGGSAEATACDLRDVQAIEALGRKVQQQHGRCDILINNAGVGIIGKPVHELAPEDWEAMVSTNLRSPYLMIRAFAPMMIAAARGHIVNISSLAGSNPLPNGAAYAATKWGLNGLTYSVAEELRDYNVRVSAVAPGGVNTDFGGCASAGADGDRKIQPADIAHIVAMLVTQAPQSFISEVKIRPTRKS